eukprot:6478679-Pyramimonas_sp.AAC.1
MPKYYSRDSNATGHHDLCVLTIRNRARTSFLGFQYRKHRNCCALTILSFCSKRNVWHADRGKP